MSVNSSSHILCSAGRSENLFWEGNQSNVNVSPLAYLRADLYCANHETLRIALGFGPSHVKSDSFAFSHQLSCPQRFFSSSMELRLCQFCSHLWLLPMWFCYRWVWQNSVAKQCFLITVTVRVTSTPWVTFWLTDGPEICEFESNLCRSVARIVSVLFCGWLQLILDDFIFWQYFFLGLLFSNIFSCTFFLLFHSCFQQKSSSVICLAKMKSCPVGISMCGAMEEGQTFSSCTVLEGEGSRLMVI